MEKKRQKKNNKNNSTTPEKSRPKEQKSSPEHLREGTAGYKTEEEKQEEKVGYLNEKTKYQIYALFARNWAMQQRQLCNTLCQMLVPLWSLSMICFLRKVVLANSEFISNTEIRLPVPFFYNIPLRPLSQIPGTIFNVTDCNEWYMYQFQDNISEEDKLFFGYNEGTPIQKADSAGMLDSKTMLTMACTEENKSVPYFKQYQHKQKTIYDYVYWEMDKIFKNEIDMAKKNSFIPGLEGVPDGSITVREANKKKLDVKLSINDSKYYQYHRNNGVSKIGIIDSTSNIIDEGQTVFMLRPVEGIMLLQDKMNQAYIKQIFNETQILSGQIFMPFTMNMDKELGKIINWTSVTLFPICLTISLPIFLALLVQEKEMRLVEIMKINGLKMKNYWIVQGIWNFITYSISVLMYWFVGRYICQLNCFMDTHALLYFELLGCWGLCQVSIAFFMCSFLNNAQSAALIGYGVAFYTSIIAGNMTQSVYSLPQKMPWQLMWYPIFPFVRANYLLLEVCTWHTCYGDYDLAPDEFREMEMYLLMDFVIYMTLAMYLNQVIPQDYGVPKHPLFFLDWQIKVISPKLHAYIFGDESELINYKETNKDELMDEDSDVDQERQDVYNIPRSTYSQYPLIAKNIRKVYPGVNGRPPKVANKNICFKVKSGELFGLLGPNGAGKTTLVTQLSGLYPPTDGNAWIGGFDIKSQLEIVQLQIGVCPQFDLLWNELTVEEHLFFFARIKGIPPHELEANVTNALKEVHLLPQRQLLITELPLGMKRRLSIAISLVSQPKIIFLDEPTTGLDPETRRQLWNILQEVKQGNRAMILTTHSMEEADVLCNRIGIVNNGVMTCIGSQDRLKELYGGGYHLFINLERASTDKEIQKVRAFVKKIAPKSEMLRFFNAQFVYQIPVEGFNAGKFFSQMDSNKSQLSITDWGISQCSLEDVFTRICELL